MRLLRQMAERAGAFTWCRSGLLVTIIGAAALATGCGSESEVSTSPSQVKCQVALASTSSSIGPDGGTGTITVTTSPECPWDVSTGAAWLSGLSPTSGQGTGAVEFRVAPNPLPVARDGEIVVNDNRLRVSQQAALCRFEVSPGSLTVDAGGGAREIAVSSASGCAWTFSTDASWLSYTTPRTGSGAGTVSVSIAPNQSDQPRTGTITVADQRITVTQSAASPSSCIYTISLTTDVSIPAPGGPATVSVSTAPGCAWTATSSVPWITVVSGPSGSGSGLVAFSVATNPGSARTGTITVAGQTVTVTQAVSAVSCTYAISPTDASIAAPGGSGTVAVSAAGGCAWTASSSVSWIAVTAGASGTGNGAVAFDVAANPGGVRTGTITVAGQTFTVTQAAAASPCTYAISPTSASIAAPGGSGTTAVSAASGCAWTASSSVSWITVTAGASGTGNGAVAFDVTANPGSARTATLTVAGRTFTVTQAAAASPCTYAIGPTNASIAAPGGSGTTAVSAASGCAWTATSNAAWVTISSGASGTGNGAVAFDVAANPGGARTGTLTVAGQTFTVTQAAAAAPCSYAISPTNASIAAPGGSGTTDVSAAAGCAWTATSNAVWVTVSSGFSGTGNGTAAFDVAANPGGVRTGTITVAGQTFTVTQAAAAAACTYAISPTNASIAAPGGNGTMGVSAASGCAWTATSNAAWVTISSGASGAGNGTVAFTVAANPGAARTGTLTVAGQTFTVTQAVAAPCTYAISPTRVDIADNGGTRTATVSTASGCTWTATSNASWITVTSGASGTGNGSVSFRISRNNGNARTGTLTIAGRTLTVVQEED